MAYRPQSDDYRQAIIDFGGGDLSIARAIAAAISQLESESEIFDGCRAVRGLAGSPRAAHVTAAFVGCLSAATMSCIAGFMRRRDLSPDTQEQVIGSVMNSLRQPNPLRNAWVACGGVEAQADLIQLYLPLAIGDGAPAPAPAPAALVAGGAAATPAPTRPPACPVARFCLYSLVALARDPALHFAFTASVRAALRAAASAPSLEVRSVAFMTLAHLAQTFDAEDEPTGVGAGPAGSSSGGSGTGAVGGSGVGSGAASGSASGSGSESDEIHIDPEAIAFIVSTLTETLNPIPGKYYGWKVPELVAALLSVSASDANKGRLGAEAVAVLLDVLEAPAQTDSWVPAIQALHNLCYNGREERRAAQAAVLKSEPSFIRRLAGLAASADTEVARNAQCTLEALGIYAVKEDGDGDGMGKHSGAAGGSATAVGVGAGDADPTVTPGSGSGAAVAGMGMPRSPSSTRRGGRRTASNAGSAADSTGPSAATLRSATSTGSKASGAPSMRTIGEADGDGDEVSAADEEADGAIDDAGNGDDYENDDYDDEENESFDVMMSYSWATQAMVLRVAAELRRLGLRVWLDVEHMGADLIASMAHAVEASTVFLLCCSSAYKASPNCRREANYCAALNKPVLVANMEHEYVPRGWLGLHVAGKIWADFREDSDDCFGRGMRTLCKQLIEQGVSTAALKALVGVGLGSSSGRGMRGSVSAKNVTIASTGTPGAGNSSSTGASSRSGSAKDIALVTASASSPPALPQMTPAVPAAVPVPPAARSDSTSSTSSGRLKVTWDLPGTVAGPIDGSKVDVLRSAGEANAQVEAIVSPPAPAPAALHGHSGQQHAPHPQQPPIVASAVAVPPGSDASGIGAATTASEPAPCPSPPPPPPVFSQPAALMPASPQPHFGGACGGSHAQGFSVSGHSTGPSSATFSAPSGSPLASPSFAGRFQFPAPASAGPSAHGSHAFAVGMGGMSADGAGIHGIHGSASPADARVHHVLSCLASHGHMRLAASLSSAGFSALSLDGLQRLLRGGDAATFHRLVQEGFGVGLVDSLALSAVLTMV